jgi:phage terminase large subunit-like protein
MAGRGFGKTRVGAELFREWAESGENSHLAIIAPTFADARDTCIEGESGLIACCGGIGGKSILENWNRSMGEIRFTNGVKAKAFAALEPERLRGPQHAKIWMDECGTPEYSTQTLDMALFGLRLGQKPQIVMTTTPRPTPLILKVKSMRGTVVTAGATRDNAANLAPGVVEDLRERYEGTRLGLQELDGVLLEDNPDALVQKAWIDRDRCGFDDVPDLVRVVVGLDPAGTRNKSSDKTGLIAVGMTKAERPHFYVLVDRSGRYRPKEWASVAISTFHRLRAARVVGETNYGGDMVKATLHSVERVPFEGVHAFKGKALRAEPVASLYEQGRVHHVGVFEELETQLTTWDPSQESPNNLDALVYAVLDLDPSVGRELQTVRNRFAQPDPAKKRFKTYPV